MKELNLISTKSDSIKIKRRGLSAIATCIVNNGSTLRPTGSRYVWPTGSSSARFEIVSAKKGWKL
ncbi:MAG: hypothetical protein R3Y43_07790 [Alphaproteobacteria bacterium]